MSFTKPLKMAFDCSWTELTDDGNTDEDNMLTLDTVVFDLTQFHEKSMTFCGNVAFSDAVCDYTKTFFYNKLECLLHFSDNGNYIRRGHLSWKFASTDVGSYPLDGSWEVTWDSPGAPSITIFVQRHQFTCLGYKYKIYLNEMRCPYFIWDEGISLLGGEVVQISRQQIPPGSSGLDVGETLSWATNAPGYETIKWVRRSMNFDEVGCWRTEKIKAGNFVYHKCNEDPGSEQSLGPTYKPNDIWGNTFCQAFCVGLASYHFIEPESNGGTHEAYISYENPRTEQWPALDNGQNVPSRVPFRNSMDENTHEVTLTFKKRRRI